MLTCSITSSSVCPSQGLPGIERVPTKSLP
jgi:hypothetical protein